MRTLRLGLACFPTLGGSGVVASELALRLASRGHAVHVFSCGAPGRLGSAPDGVILHEVDPMVRAPLERGADTLSLAAAMAAVAQREELEVLHAHYALPHAVSALLAKEIVQREGGRAPRVVTTLHGTDAGLVGADPKLAPVTRHAVLASDALTAPSAWLARSAHETLALPERTRIEVLPNFVDPDEFHPAQPQPLARVLPEAPWPGRPRVLLHASNFRPLKRVSDLVLAFAQVQQHVDAVLVLVGHGPEQLAVERLAASLGLQDRVVCVGERVQFASLLAQADLFLLPSDTESFGLAALEALACGVPVVASAVGGLPEVVRDGATGLLVPPRDPHALAAAMLSLLRDEPRRQQLARTARADVLARFRPGPIVERWERLYESISLPRP